MASSIVFGTDEASLFAIILALSILIDHLEPKSHHKALQWTICFADNGTKSGRNECPPALLVELYRIVLPKTIELGFRRTKKHRTSTSEPTPYCLL